jgi:PAS domain S-box-containing protein
MGKAEEQLANELRAAQEQIVALEASVRELERAREKLHELEQMVNQSPTIFFLWRAAEGWPVEFVSGNVRQFGYTPEDFYTGRVPYASIVHPDDLERVEAEVAEYSQEEGRTEFAQAYRIITQTDEVRWTDDRTWIKRDADGKITHYQGVIMDVTDRKQAEEALRREEERYKLALSATRDGFWDWNLKTNEVYYSPRYYTMLGYEPGEFDASVDSWEELVEPNDLAAANAKSEAYFQGEMPEYQTEFRVRAKSGEWVWILSRGAIVERDEEGEPVRMTGTHTDITRLKRVEGEQERLQQEVIEAQRQALQELSTPIIPVMERIIVMPLVGSIDTMRARDITRSLLAGIREHRAKVVILDITGVGMVDSGVADHLNKTIQAARLKGARTIVTGISDAVAETIVDLGIDWGSVETLSDLQTGLVMALNNLGIKLSTSSQ